MPRFGALRTIDPADGPDTALGITRSAASYLQCHKIIIQPQSLMVPARENEVNRVRVQIQARRVGKDVCRIECSASGKRSIEGLIGILSWGHGL